MPKPTRTLLTNRSPLPTAPRPSMFGPTKSPAPQPDWQSQAIKPAKSSPAPLLITKSRQEYKKLRGALRKEIDPQGPIERMYLADIAQQEWEIRRWRRAKVALLNAAYREVLTAFLSELIRRPGQATWDVDDKAEIMAFAWFSEPKVQKRVAKRLADYGLDATAIEAKVLQHCCSQLAEFDRLLASAESRRMKAVRAVAEYRASLRCHIADADRASASKVTKDDAPVAPARAKPTLLLRYRGKSKDKDAA